MRRVSRTLVVVLVAWGTLPTVVRGGDRPNVVFVVIDTLRADHVGCYGYRRPTTPALDQLAAEGGRLATVVAAGSWTMPSLGTMMCGVAPAVHGGVSYEQRLREDLTTLAAEFQRAGYQTAGLVANPTVNRKFGFAKGFADYDDYTVFLGADLDLFESRAGPAGIWRSLTSPALNRLAVDWLRQQRRPDQPFFLFLFYFDPHYDYTPPADYAARFTDPAYAGGQNGRDVLKLRGQPLAVEDQRQLVALHDAEVRYTDDHLGQVLAELRKLGLYDQTVVSVIADHGEEFWEHGSCAHAHTLYDELLLVPWAVRYPGAIGAGTVVAEQVSHLDVMPTLLGLAGLPVPAQCHGRNLALRLGGGAEPLAARPAFFEIALTSQLYGARTPTQKIIIDRQGGLAQWYDLTQDPGERHDLAHGPWPPEFAGLRAQLDAWNQAMRAAHQPVGQPLDPGLTQQLKSLGYLQ